MSTLAYKSNADEVLRRLRRLYDRQAPDEIFAVFTVPSPTVQEFRKSHSEGACDYPNLDERVDFWDRLLQERAALEDDSIPSVYLSELDQGLYGGLLGGEVRFVCDPGTGWISSMVPPLLADWSQFESLRIDDRHPWFQRYQTHLKRFAERSKGRFGISHFILIDSLNFVYELVGATATYLAVEERPELVRRAVDFAFDLNVKVQQTFFDAYPGIGGGTCSNMAQWLPGRSVSESVDPFHMTSPAYFEEWGRAPIERIFARFDGGGVHIHGNGRHLLKAVSTLKGLRVICLADDRGYPLAFDILPDLKKRVGEMPVTVFTSYESFVPKLEKQQLTGGVLYNVANTPSADAANRCMEKVRAYRA